MTSDEKKNEELQVSRRQLLRTGVGLAGAGLVGAGLAGSRLSGADWRPVSRRSQRSKRGALLRLASSESMVGVKFEARDMVRLGVIGVGGRGTGMLGNFLAIPHLQVNAICDSVKEHATHAPNGGEERREEAGDLRERRARLRESCASGTIWISFTSRRRGSGTRRWGLRR